MKVSGVGPTGKTDKAKTAKKPSAGGDFADSLRGVSAGPAETAAPVSAPVVTGVDVVLAAQAAGDATEGRSRGLIDRGNKLLEHLDEIQLAVLDGRMPKDKVIELAQDLREKRQNSDDPALEAILDEIELRAEVELAKLTR